MPILKTEAKKYNFKRMKNQIYGCIYIEGKIPLELIQLKSSVHALISKVAHSIFTLVTPVLAPPAKDYQKQTCSLTYFLPHCNQSTL